MQQIILQSEEGQGVLCDRSYIKGANYCQGAPSGALVVAVGVAAEVTGKFERITYPLLESADLDGIM
jgi:hypothetical protein